MIRDALSGLFIVMRSTRPFENIRRARAKGSKRPRLAYENRNHEKREDKMKIGKKISLLALVLSFFFFFSPSISFPVSSIESLKGLKGVEVLIEELNPDLENLNLTMIQIQSDVESKLRKAGVQVLSKEENEKVQPLRKPYLYIRINSCKLSSRKESIAFNIGIALNQQVTLRGQADSKKCFFAPTWYTSVVGAAGRKNIQEILDTVQDLTDKFINAYLKANSKE
jgi:hypothetical protein